MAINPMITSGYDSGMLPDISSTNYAQFLQDLANEAIVIDVIVDHTHKKYSKKDGFNVGNIQFRIFSDHFGIKDELLPWARPLDPGFQEFPVIGEMVYLQRIASQYWYRKRVPIARRLNQNAMINVNNTINESVFENSTLASQVELTFDKFKFGQYWKPDARVRQVKAFEGDTLLQGRMGASIRFGSSKMSTVDTGIAPNIIMRVGQGKDIEKTEVSAKTPYGLIMEDVNKDMSSIWMTSDQSVGFRPATRKAGSIYRSLFNPPQSYNKAQIIANSDRVILNAKNTHIMLFANEEIYLNAFARVGIDTEGSVLMTANNDIDLKTGRNVDVIADEDITMKAYSDIALFSGERFSILGKQVYIGRMPTLANYVEPAVGGTSLAMFLGRLILALMGPGAIPLQIPYQNTGAPMPVPSVPPVAAPGLANFAHVITPLGPGLLNPAITTALTQLYFELVMPNLGQLIPFPFSGAPFSSNGVFVALSPEETKPVIPKNDFKLGEQFEQEKVEWRTKQNDYKVTE